MAELWSDDKRSYVWPDLSNSDVTNITRVRALSIRHSPFAFGPLRFPSSPYPRTSLHPHTTPNSYPHTTFYLIPPLTAFHPLSSYYSLPLPSHVFLLLFNPHYSSQTLTIHPHLKASSFTFPSAFSSMPYLHPIPSRTLSWPQVPTQAWSSFKLTLQFFSQDISKADQILNRFFVNPVISDILVDNFLVVTHLLPFKLVKLMILFFLLFLYNFKYHMYS